MSFFREYLAHRRRIRIFAMWIQAVKWAERDAWTTTSLMRGGDSECYRRLFRDRVDALRHGLAGITEAEAEATAEQVLGEMNRALKP